MSIPPKADYRRELLLNQVWQGLNFLSKAGFLGLLTPLMQYVWGPIGYGMFALSSSLLVSLAILDCGVRSLTRLRLCEALVKDDREDFSFAVIEGVSAFALVAFFAAGGAAVLAYFHVWSRWLQLPPEGDLLVALTVGMVGLFMLSVLLLEPLAAKGSVSALKAANTLGALIGIPAVGLLVWFKGSVTAATTLYFICLISPNIVLFVTQVRPLIYLSSLTRLRPAHVITTLKSGGWFYLTTLSLVAKTHALTFIVSSISGPEVAGTFYILLRITEIIGGLGASSSDTSLASLANETDPAKRAQNFRHSYEYALIFCMHGTLGLGFLLPILMPYWLKDTPISSPLAWTMALYGLSAAASRVIVNASMGTNLVRQAALGNMVEAVFVLLSGLILQHEYGLPGLFSGATIAIVALIPVSLSLSKNFQQHPCVTWLVPIVAQGRAILITGAALFAASWVGGIVSAIAAGAVTGAVALYSLKNLHRA